MSSQGFEKIRQVAANASVEACWRQWAALGAPASTPRPASSSIIDPEALVLLTMGVIPHERRLADMLGWWARVGSSHLSLTRLQSLAGAFPFDARDRLGDFASMAVGAGDRRWKKFATGHTAGADREKGRDRPRLTGNPALMLRIRAGFGLGIKSDLLAVLMGFFGNPVNVQTLLHATGYSEPPLRTAARDMATAGLIHKTSDRPVRYYVQITPRHLFGEPLRYASNPPVEAHVREGSPGESVFVDADARWSFWADVFPFLTHTIATGDLLRRQGVTRYVASSRARDLYEKHVAAFERNGIHVPSPTEHRGEAYLEAFLLTVESTAEWMSRAL